MRSLAVVMLAIVSFSAQADPRILVIGDSWAQLIGAYGSFETVLANEGLTDVSVINIGDGGSTAEQWSNNEAGKLDAITAVLTNNPTIDIVHVNMGGNDILGIIGSVSTEEELAAALGPIQDDVGVVVSHILSVRPDAHIALCSYDYVSSAGLNWLHPVYVDVAKETAPAQGAFFMNATGWTQYVFGYPGEFGPGEVPAPGGFPEYDPAAGGDIGLPSPPDYHDDGIHLVEESYQTYIERAFSECYRAWLNADAGGATVYVDFSFIGDERGTPSEPMNDLTFAVELVNVGGTLAIAGDASKTTSIETLTIDKAMTLTAVNGTVQIGVAGAGEQPPEAAPGSGFTRR